MKDVVSDSFPGADASLDDQAMAWVVRLTSGRSSAADHDAFRHWRGQSGDHDAALVRSRALWLELGAAVNAIETRRRNAPPAARRWAAGLAIAASLALVVGLGEQYRAVWRFDHVTAPGERQLLTLADGSQVLLSGDTALNVDVDRGRRQVTLARGEAMFAVRHEAARPFMVATDHGVFRDVGTVFDVKTAARESTLAVSRGSVRASAGADTALLTQGQAVVARDGGLGATRRIDIASQLAWTRRLLIVDDRPLAEIVEALAPYYRRRIVLLNRAAGRDRLSATIRLGQIDDWVDALAGTGKVRIYRVGGYTIIA